MNIYARIVENVLRSFVRSKMLIHLFYVNYARVTKQNVRFRYFTPKVAHKSLRVETMEDVLGVRVAPALPAIAINLSYQRS